MLELNKKSRKFLNRNKLTIGVIILLLVFSLGAILLSILFQDEGKTDYSNWSNFSSEDLGVSMKYPKEWSVNDFPESESKNQIINIRNDGEFLATIQIDKKESYTSLPDGEDCPSDKYIPCEDLTEFLDFAYDSSEFVSVSSKSLGELLLPISGQAILNDKEEAVSVSAEVGSNEYKILQVKESKASQVIFSSDEFNKAFIISYQFNDEESIEKWPEIMESLEGILASIDLQ